MSDIKVSYILDPETENDIHGFRMAPNIIGYRVWVNGFKTIEVLPVEDIEYSESAPYIALLERHGCVVDEEEETL